MARRNKADRPVEILMPMDMDEPKPDRRRRGTRADPSMRDGNSSHGNPGEDATDEITTDNDVGDELEGRPPYAGHGGAVGGTPAGRRTKGGHQRGFDPGTEHRGDSTIGAG
jgi:hypothetical protein